MLEKESLESREEIMKKRSYRLLLGALLLGGAWSISGTTAQDATPIAFALDFSLQGPQSIFLLASEKGYFAQEGLTVTVSRGFGSSDTVQKVAVGSYDFGFGDINAVIEENVSFPGQEVIGVAMVYNNPPHAVMALKGKGINSPKDLEGKTLVAPAGDAARRLFPVYANAVGIDASKVNFVNVEAAVRETTLARGQADAISGFEFTSVLNLKNAGVKEDDVVTFMYSDYLKNLYGNAIIVSKAYAQKNPETVRAFLRAVTKAWKDAIAKPEEAIAALKKRDPSINETLEKDRLIRVLKRNIYVRDVELFGFGTVRKDRITGAIRLITDAYGLPVRLTDDNVFSSAYLPPLADRLPPSKKGF
jgi:NitT/TauT family transport system substrate-binding protein